MENKVIRYWVAACANIRRGWLVKTVELSADGREVEGRQSWRFRTKREAQAYRDQMNAKVGQ